MIKTAFITAFIAAVFTRTAFAERVADAGVLTKALVAYQDALKKGDIKAAKFKSTPAKALEPVAGSAKVIGEFAAVAFLDGDKDRPERDSAYLMRQDEEWKVFLRLTKWDHPMFDLSMEQKKQLGEFQEWFATEKKRLLGQ